MCLVNPRWSSPALRRQNQHGNNLWADKYLLVVLFLWLLCGWEWKAFSTFPWFTSNGLKITSEPPLERLNMLWNTVVWQFFYFCGFDIILALTFGYSSCALWPSTLFHFLSWNNFFLLCWAISSQRKKLTLCDQLPKLCKTLVMLQSSNLSEKLEDNLVWKINMKM